MNKETLQEKVIDLKSNSVTYDKNDDKYNIDINTNQTSILSAAVAVGTLVTTSIYFWRRTKSLKAKNKFLKTENKNLSKVIDSKK